MKPDLHFEFRADKDANTITVKREFAAKRQLVWDCYTTSELLDKWFAPKTFTTKTKFMDFREGGHWHYAMVDQDGNEYWGRMDYQTIRPTDNYTSLDGFCDESGTVNTELPRSHWDVAFADVSARTLVTTVISYKSTADLEKILEMGMEDGMASTLERLDELLATLSTQRA